MLIAGRRGLVVEISRMIESQPDSFARRGDGENPKLETHGVWLYPGMALANLPF